ncbi:GNAT family N-acetyltransferase [Hymenobacter chitinivorans]|uniref:Acetyltransferase (GNAT) family protein n=1 Tax=Hymenobacter chitinivorans DSM 11115 TaxID=1121954 RepID=A0A2M9BLG2_9BACT|nr:GNAT family N-acetyltransferase [Hymenobacter chitinivorans]PJJ58797.1 acetyltransferase (GNAT) family protein [Hymenobacter chitinivorans DSM 11115]
MRWTIVEYVPQYAEPLRLLYLRARQRAFTWLDAAQFSLEDFDAVTRGETILVVLNQAEPVGFIAWWPPDNFIHSLFVAPEQHGQGIGQALLQACLARMGRPATLKCLQQNTRALGFYRALGWTITAEGDSSEGPYFLLTLR